MMRINRLGGYWAALAAPQEGFRDLGFGILGLHRPVVRRWAWPMRVGRRLSLLARLEIDPIARDLRPGAVDVVPHDLASPMGVAVGVQHTVVVLGVLEIVLHGDSVTCGARIPRQGQVLLHDLIGVSPHPHVSAAPAVEALRA